MCFKKDKTCLPNTYCKVLYMYQHRKICPFAPMNHVKIFKGCPPRDVPSKLVQLWYKTFPPDQPEKDINPHEKLLGIQWVSNPSAENKQISTPDHSNGCKWKMHVSSEPMVQIKTKGVHGVENPLPRIFFGGQVKKDTFIKCVLQGTVHVSAQTDMSMHVYPSVERYLSRWRKTFLSNNYCNVLYMYMYLHRKYIYACLC